MRKSVKKKRNVLTNSLEIVHYNLLYSLSWVTLIYKSAHTWEGTELLGVATFLLSHDGNGPASQSIHYATLTWWWILMSWSFLQYRLSSTNIDIYINILYCTCKVKIRFLKVRKIKYAVLQYMMSVQIVIKLICCFKVNSKYRTPLIMIENDFKMIEIFYHNRTIIIYY